MIKRFFYTLKQAFLQVFRNRAMSLASIFAITAMLLILGIFFILVINVNTAAQTISQDYDSIEIFLKEDATTAQKDAIINDMKARDGVEDAYFKSKDTAMDEFKTRWGENAYLLDSLKDNPLPDSVVVLIADLEKPMISPLRQVLSTVWRTSSSTRIPWTSCWTQRDSYR